MPLIIPANTLLDLGYNISNSIRFNSGDNPEIAKTPSSASNRRTWTWSCWIKRGLISSFNVWGAGSSVDNRAHFDFNSNGSFQVEAKNGGSSVLKHEGGVNLRDVSAWYHLVWRLDTTQSSASDRSRVYVNGSQVTFSSTGTTPSQNDELEINNTSPHKIGLRSYTDGNFMNGYISEIHFVDGTSLAPTSFAETDDNGFWIPKDCKDDLTYGTNGFYMEFKQTGTSANSSGMGADTSGNNNHFDLGNLTATDITTDTPTNNFATANPLDVRQGATFSEGNCKIVTNSSNRNYVISTIGVTSGKWYCEAKITDGNTNAWLGVADFDDLLTSSASTLGDNSNEIGLNYEGTYQKNNTNNASWGGSYANNDILGILLDMDNNRITYHKNGSYADGSGNFDESSPTAYISFTNSTMGFAFGDGAGAGTSTYEINFGNAPFTISSGNSDANGYGNFEYAVPSGYYSLCTKNLAEYG